MLIERVSVCPVKVPSNKVGVVKNNIVSTDFSSKNDCYVSEKKAVSFGNGTGAVLGYIGGTGLWLAICASIPGPGWVAGAALVGLQAAGAKAGDKLSGKDE